VGFFCSAPDHNPTIPTDDNDRFSSEPTIRLGASHVFESPQLNTVNKSDQNGKLPV
jgi:hypothetical protein